MAGGEIGSILGYIDFTQHTLSIKVIKYFSVRRTFSPCILDLLVPTFMQERCFTYFSGCGTPQ